MLGLNVDHCAGTTKTALKKEKLKTHLESTSCGLASIRASLAMPNAELVSLRTPDPVPIHSDRRAAFAMQAEEPAFIG